MITTTSFNSSVVDMSSSLNRSLQPKYKFGLSTGRMTKTPMSNGTSRSPRSFTVAALCEGRGPDKGTIGLAVMDVRHPIVELYEFIDSSSFLRLKTKLNVDDPAEVVVADSINERKSTLLLMEAVKNSSTDASITLVHKRYFSDSRGAELVKQLANPESSNCDLVIRQQKKYCMAACGALLKYIEFIQNVLFSGLSLKINYCDVEKICMIDVGSWKCLELVDNCEMAITKKVRRSLLSVINYTLTPSGFRLLRSNLLQPLAEKKAIERRLDAVEELLDNEHFLQRIREILARVHELDNVLALCIQANKEDEDVQSCENNIMQLLRLKQTLQIVAPLRHSLENAKSGLLNGMKQQLADKRIDEMMSIMDDTLDGTVLIVNKKNSLILRNQKCYAVKEGVSVNLDVARRAYEEMLRDLQSADTTGELHEHLPEQNVRLAYSITRGFHYVWVIPEAATAQLPLIFINDVRNRSSITFSSKKLTRYNDRINQCVAEVMLASNVIVCDVIEKIRTRIPVLYNIMDVAANLDFLASLAVYSSNIDTTRPVIGNMLMFKEGRHPLLDFHLGEKCISNDTYLSRESNFAIITGPNMAGKSTYLRQVCQLSVLAQLGCMIPAEVAVVPMFTRIFSRVGHNDDVAKGFSAFALEMSEMATIMHFADKQSLIVIDELARSTSTEEGIGISYAIAEFLLKHEAFVFLATHFLDLASLDERNIRVENYHFRPQTRTDDIGNEVYDASHRLYKGAYSGPLYGFELVELSTFPFGVIQNAKEMAKRLKQANDKKTKQTTDWATRRLMVRTALKLRHALVMREGVSDEVMINYLEQTRKQFQRGMKNIEEDAARQELEKAGEPAEDEENVTEEAKMTEETQVVEDKTQEATQDLFDNDDEEEEAIVL